MDKISNTYVDSNSQREAAIKIVDSRGDCTGLNICESCPMFNECINSIKNVARFLPRPVRLRKAEEYLFIIALEQEIG